MPIRDLIVFIIVFGSLPFILKRPYLGILVYAWLGYMNPHRLTWGPAFQFQFAMIVAVTTIVGALLTSQKRLPRNFTIAVLFTFVIWCGITTQFALNPFGAYSEWDRFLKIQLMIFMCLILIDDFDKINHLLYIIVLSIGFYGIKGGLFTLRTGGKYMVVGPPYSFISGNTEIGFALVIIFPLVWYLATMQKKRWLKILIFAAIGLIAISIVGTQSRGAFLAVACTLLFLWLKNKHKIKYGIVIMVMAIIALVIMPEQYFDKLETIRTYQQDGSAMGRVNAWYFAYNLSKDYPITGGGFNAFTANLFQRYAPNPNDLHDAHSIYFEVLGEQGYIGLFLFLFLGILTYRNASITIKLSKDRPELKNQHTLGKMIQASIVGYGTGGAFLGLAYFDLPYHLVVITIILRELTNLEVLNSEKKRNHIIYP